MSIKMELQFEGLEAMADQIMALADLGKAAAEDALTQTAEIVNPKAQAAIAPHHRTGQTEGSIGQAPVKWASDTEASVDVGFMVHLGGLASIFLMYGTPKVAPDPALFNAFYGSATEAEIQDAQREAFERALA
jgi:hypothetical protein